MAKRKKSFDEQHYKPKEISVKKFKAYEKRHGSERAAGYHDALKDMANNIEGLFYKHNVEGYYFYNTPPVVHRRLWEFKQYTDQLLEDIREVEESKKTVQGKLDSNELK